MEFQANDLKKWDGAKAALAVFAWEEEKAPVLIGLPKGADAKALAALAREEGFKGKERSVVSLRPEQARDLPGYCIPMLLVCHAR